MARFEDGGTVRIVEWQGEQWVLTVLTRTALRELTIPRALAPEVGALLWPEGVAALRAVLTAAEVSPSDVFEGSDETPLYDDGSWFNLGLLAKIRAALAHLDAAGGA